MICRGSNPSLRSWPGGRFIVFRLIDTHFWSVGWFERWYGDWGVELFFILFFSDFLGSGSGWGPSHILKIFLKWLVEPIIYVVTRDCDKEAMGCRPEAGHWMNETDIWKRQNLAVRKLILWTALLTTRQRLPPALGLRLVDQTVSIADGVG